MIGVTTPADLPWPPGAATGVGSLPGEDPYEALRIVLGELPDLPYLPELPARGPGADLVGRGAALLVDLPVDLQPAGWRLVERPGRDLRRARDLLARDLDALEELTHGYEGPLKIQAAGPWTLAATLELQRGDKALADPGAIRDLAASLADGLAAHAREVARRAPGARLLVQLDEPALPAVLAGSVPTASGFGALRAIDRPDVVAGLRTVVDAVAGDAYPLVHCCARRAPIALLAESGAAAVSLDARLLAPEQDDEIGAAVEAGRGLLLGVVPSTGAELSDLGGTVAPVRALWHRLGLDPAELARTVVATPACGLAGAPLPYARAALARCREVGRVLVEDPEG